MENSLEKIQEDLKFQPPVVLTLEDTDVANGVMNGHTRMHLEPGNWPAALWCWCRCSEIVCFLLIDIDCFTGKVFGSGAVYKICGEKCGLILFPVAVIKKKKQQLDCCDSELIWKEAALLRKFRRVTWQVVFLTRVKSTCLNVIKEIFIFFCWKSFIELYSFAHSLSLSFSLWQWVLLSSLSETLQICTEKAPLLDGGRGGLWGCKWAGAGARASRPLSVWFSVGHPSFPWDFWVLLWGKKC